MLTARTPGAAFVVTAIVLFTVGGISARGVTEERYPARFHNTSDIAAAGFGEKGRFEGANACSLATQQAKRMLAWSGKVRITGEALYEISPSGQLAFRGSNIEISEITNDSEERLSIDTLSLGSRCFAFAANYEMAQASDVASSFSAVEPAWVSRRPQRSTALLCEVGVAELAFHDEAGSWEVATYRALLSLANGVRSKTTSVEWFTEDTQTAAQVHKVDIAITGFRVVSRWRSPRMVYVLGCGRADVRDTGLAE
jgi:hypothetical protein